MEAPDLKEERYEMNTFDKCIVRDVRWICVSGMSTKQGPQFGNTTNTTLTMVVPAGSRISHE
ncbi:hypothetical protein [Brevibacterium sp. FME37]|uniref:hypothetical protein n=1 Tax=Brevibacterium sp. FME37 TaxID=2742607 RepID=UPI0018685696|nr:hypothetical protein [Brevibacterium sp. FME37]